jgi:hypothetical protein
VRNEDTSELAVVWRLRFADNATARFYLDAFRGEGPWSVWRSERDIILLASGSGELVDRYGGMNDFGSLAEVSTETARRLSRPARRPSIATIPPPLCTETRSRYAQ